LLWLITVLQDPVLYIQCSETI